MPLKILNALGPLSQIFQEVEDSTQCITSRVEIVLREFKEFICQSA